MSYDILIANMRKCGLHTNACEFTSSYLNVKYQRVKILNEFSLWMSLLKWDSTMLYYPIISQSKKEVNY